jgi:hypothetical protein
MRLGRPPTRHLSLAHPSGTRADTLSRSATGYELDAALISDSISAWIALASHIPTTTWSSRSIVVKSTPRSREVRWALRTGAVPSPVFGAGCGFAGGRITLPQRATRGTRVLARGTIAGRSDRGVENGDAILRGAASYFGEPTKVSCIPDRYSSPTTPVGPVQAAGAHR